MYVTLWSHGPLMVYHMVSSWCTQECHTEMTISLLVHLDNWNCVVNYWYQTGCDFILQRVRPIFHTQQDYYGRRCGTPLHSYCISTYTEVTVLFLWSSSSATLEYPHRYSNRVAVWVLHGNSRVTSQEQHSYFSVGTSACSNCVMGYHIAGHSNLAV